MGTFRQLGGKEYQSVLRVKAAKESAISAENAKIDLIKSQDSEVDSEIDNITASSVENSTGEAMRL